MRGIPKRLGVILLSLVFMVSLVSATRVDAARPYRWEMASSVNLPPWSIDNPTWVGDIWNDEGEHGDFYWYNEGAYFLGPEDDPKVQQFWGIWWIDWDDGSHIQGTHDGTFVYAISQYTINGRITVATGEWSVLVGHRIHTVGFVDWTGGIYGIGYSESILQIC